MMMIFLYKFIMIYFLLLKINIINIMLNAFNDLIMKYIILTCMFINMFSEKIINKQMF